MKTILTSVLAGLTMLAQAAPIELVDVKGRKITVQVLGTDGDAITVFKDDWSQHRIPLNSLSDASKTAVARELAIIADFADVIGKGKAAAEARFGKPVYDKPSFQNWHKDGWDWSVTFKGDKIISGRVDEAPKDKAPGDLSAVPALFGFNKEKGWVLGEIYHKGLGGMRRDCALLTHAQHGVFTVEAWREKPEDKYSWIKFLAPGREILETITFELSKSGAEFVETSDGAFVITLSNSMAMTISLRLAQELALTTRARIGASVSVVSPAGQVLAESP